MTGDLHTHSIYDDGKNSLLEMAEAAESLGLDFFGFSGHSFQTGGEDFCISDERMADYLSEAKAIKQLFLREERRTAIYVGLELDLLGRPENGLDYVIGSAHGFMIDGRLCNVDESPGALQWLIKEHFDNDPYKMTDAYYDNIARLSDSMDCDIIGHFDLVTKFNEKCRMFDAGSRRYLSRALEAMEHLSRKGLIFEVNTGAMSRGWRTEPYPDMVLLKTLCGMGGRIIINSDSHHIGTIAHGFDRAKARALEAGFRSVWVFTDQGFEEIPLDGFGNKI